MPDEDNDRPSLPHEIPKPDLLPILVDDLQQTRLEQIPYMRRRIHVERRVLRRLPHFLFLARFSCFPGSRRSFGGLNFV